MATAIINSQMDAINESFSRISSDLTTIRPLLKNASIGAYPTDSASGSIASFTDGADDVPVKELKVNIEPIQSGSGDPSPTNVRPISGHTEVNVIRTGRNLIKYRDDIEIPTTYNGITYSWGENGAIILNGTASAVSYVNITKADDPTPFRTGEEYHFKLFGAIEGVTLPLRLDSTWIGSSDEYTYTFSEFETAYLRLRIASGTVCNNLEVKPMVSLQTQWTGEYEPLAVATYNFPLGQTVYGGTLNVSTGVLTVDTLTKKVSDFSWSEYSTPASHIFRAVYLNVMPDLLIPESNTPVDAISEAFVAIDWTNISGTSNGSFAVAPRANNRFVIIDHRYSTVSDFVTNEGNITFVFKLATPTTVQLTPAQVSTLLGQNNIFSDSGDVDVVYRADTGLYIDKKLAQALNA